SGTAMGTKAAPTYANLVMGYLETLLYNEAKNKFGDPFHLYLLNHWKRYLDDCFILWTHTPDLLKDFHNLLNSLNPNIQFTIEYSNKQLPFLDILIINQNTFLETDLYTKPTDSQQYLLFTSCHPKHTKTNIPFNMARRVCTIVSNQSTKQMRLQELHDILLERKYPATLIQNGITRALTLNTQDLRTTRPHKEKPHLIPYISTHNPRNTEAYNIIHKNIPFLMKDHRLKETINKHKIIKCKRQPKSLKKLLTNAKIPNPNSHPSISKCNRPNCGICDYLLESPNYSFKSGQRFQIKHSFSCTSSNLIYLIRCAGCGEEYIGQTGLTLRKRFTVHRQQIKFPHTRKIPLSAHLASCPTNCQPSYHIYPLYQCLKNSETFRIFKEQHFITTFKPKLNSI
ncbi:uncharacterized protein LOC115230173, partial [Argonauta hians]